MIKMLHLIRQRPNIYVIYSWGLLTSTWISESRTSKISGIFWLN